MSRFWKIALIVVAVIVVGGIGFRLLHKPAAEEGAQGQHGGQHKGQGQGDAAGQDKDAAPVPVTVEPVVKQDVPVYLTALGTVQALNTVTVNPQIGGQMLSINFKEGQEVKKGDLLAQIDPRPFQAAYDQAVGKQQMDEAQLSTAQSTLKRNDALVAKGYVAQLDMDTYRNNVANLIASVTADKAAVRAAKVNLDFTRIISPIDGVAGIRQVDPGNVVITTTNLVTLTQIHPIYVMFNLPEQNLEAVRSASGNGDPLEVLALDRADAHTIADDGQLNVIDNQIDTTTGTFKLRSVFQNTKADLWPGQFVNVRLKVRTVSGGLVIPAQAVQRGPDGDYVYLLQQDQTVKMQPVKVANEVGDSHVMITSGLALNDQVVTEGQFRLKPGSKVKALKPGEVPAAPTTAEMDKAKKNAKQQGGGGRRGG
ncbi:MULTISPECIES: efflux RND transporter periplasmic adaptor subunit [Dyella]|uniref:efflux RND transporter periplasmic adaptor subunit n=1 Tax=Dyella TaxID=231454 RepID=UPI000C81C4D7|nr:MULTISPECIES: efflux RND transporter periplasmic adaptor subunit [Dyella]MDR3446950.1 efflux RND transporter periplasmic adaptor subunit [Dyella sp.]PMQ04917.1 Multidrug resistance protein MdtA [Dyella sp. AD56]ULU26413.1 efflux RND transporter periplasmic adaptor subunit [Dyella terrae]